MHPAMNTSEIPRVWWIWLLVAYALTALTALASVVFPAATLSAMSGTFLGSPDALTVHGDEVVRFFGLISGISAGVSLAWIAALSFIVVGPFRRCERWAWWAIVASTLMWFVVDSGRSIATGFADNARYNVLWLTMYGIPLIATHRRFHRGPTARPREAHPPEVGA
jgi:hypothetical protein